MQLTILILNKIYTKKRNYFFTKKSDKFYNIHETNTL